VFIRGALGGRAIGAILSSLEIFVLRRNVGAFFRRLPFLPYLGLRVSLYGGVVALVSAVMNWLVTPDGLVIMSRADIVFTVVICICTILLFGINDLLAPGVLFAFVAGRYYYPRLEERALLFIDMRSSTAIAESLGEVRFLAFLNRFVTDLSLSVLEGGGEIHKYVGDEVFSSGSSPQVQTKRAASVPAFPLSTASRGRPRLGTRFRLSRRFPRGPALRSRGRGRTWLRQEGDRAVLSREG
jgi:adenylate cyclase